MISVIHFGVVIINLVLLFITLNKYLFTWPGMVSSGASFTSCGEGASLALVGHPSGDGVTVKMPYGVDVLLHRPASHPIFSYWVC